MQGEIMCVTEVSLQVICLLPEGSATTLKAVRDFEITEISKSISDFCLISGDF